LSIASFLSDYIKIDISSAYAEILDLMLPEIMRANLIDTDNKSAVLQEVSKSNFILSQKLVEAVSLLESTELKVSTLHSAAVKLYVWLQKIMSQPGQNAFIGANPAGLSDEELGLITGEKINEKW
jgi:hypothetical protein